MFERQHVFLASDRGEKNITSFQRRGKETVKCLIVEDNLREYVMKFSAAATAEEFTSILYKIHQYERKKECPDFYEILIHTICARGDPGLLLLLISLSKKFIQPRVLCSLRCQGINPLQRACFEGYDYCRVTMERKFGPKDKHTLSSHLDVIKILQYYAPLENITNESFVDVRDYEYRPCCYHPEPSMGPSLPRKGQKYDPYSGFISLQTHLSLGITLSVNINSPVPSPKNTISLVAFGSSPEIAEYIAHSIAEELPLDMSFDRSSIHYIVLSKNQILFDALLLKISKEPMRRNVLGYCYLLVEKIAELGTVEMLKKIEKELPNFLSWIKVFIYRSNIVTAGYHLNYPVLRHMLDLHSEIDMPLFRADETEALKIMLEAGVVIKNEKKTLEIYRENRFNKLAEYFEERGYGGKLRENLKPHEDFFSGYVSGKFTDHPCL